jgi:hypothetical protein
MNQPANHAIKITAKTDKINNYYKFFIYQTKSLKIKITSNNIRMVLNTVMTGKKQI